MAVVPMAVYGLEVPCGGMPIAAKGDIPCAFRITMAAIDPTAEAEFDEDYPKGSKPRATLKIIRAPLDMEMDEDESDFDPEEMDAMLAGESDDEEEEAGPSDPTKSNKARKAAAAKQLKAELESMDVDSPKVKGKGKAAAAAAAEEDDSEDDEDDEDDEEFEPEEFVLCTLDPESHYQQTIDITIGDDERVWFQVTGTHSIYLTGNYVEPDHHHGHDEDDEDEYDMSPDEDELDYDEEESDDDLDDMENPRVMEIDEEEAPALVKADTKKADKKGKNKRAAEETTTLDDLIASAKPADKKQQKKLKTNEGKAVPADEVAKKVEAPKTDKKVQFSKNLEMGPTGSPAAAAKSGAEKTSKAAAPAVKVVQGITIDDKKTGTGPAAKRGDRIGMRYIGKLQNGKVFDSNKKGKPFSFKLGTGEVIKGWDIGIAGIQVGGERRITVPAQHAYGSKSLPGIPGNSTLIFDVKCVEIK